MHSYVHNSVFIGSACQLVVHMSRRRVIPHFHYCYFAMDRNLHESIRCDCLTREVHGCCIDQRFMCVSYKTCSGQYTKVALNQGKAVCAGMDGKAGLGSSWSGPYFLSTS